MHCQACGATNPGVFPGGAYRCTSCGAENRASMPAPRPPAQSTSAYREAAERPTMEPPDVACPFCGNMCPPATETCPHCEVRLSKVRCPRCFALQSTGDRGCARCGHELELEPLLDASDAPCPRCGKHMSSLGDRGMHECTTCGGLFVDHPTLARIVEDRNASGPLPIATARPFERARHPVAALDDVRYLKCAQCHKPMNRVNFGRRSGVVVDVCKVHGTWFDAGELSRAAEWVAGGGFEAVAAREEAARRMEAEPERAAKAKAQAAVQVAMMTEAIRETRSLGRRVTIAEDLIDVTIRVLLGS